MNSARCCVSLLLLVCSAAFAQRPHASFFQLSAVCGTESRRGWGEVFGISGGTWKRFSAANIVPSDIPQVAQVWQGPFGNYLVTINATSPDSSSETSYCFNPDGSLTAATNEVFTRWSWGYRTSARMTSVGTLSIVSEHYFDLRTGRDLEGGVNPKGKQRVKLTPAAYLHFQDLPFFDLFTPLKDSEKY